MKTKDRRFIKTQKAIYNAFSALLLKKDFTDITVNDISQSADINRSTFYLHFEDKYALLEAYLFQLLPIANLEETENLSYEELINRSLGCLYDYLHRRRLFFKKLFNKTNYPFTLTAVRKALEQFFEMKQTIFHNQLGESEEFTRHIRITGLIAMVEWYLKQDKQDKRQFIRETRDLILLLENK